MLAELSLPLMPLADFWYAFKTSSFMAGKVVVSILVCASIISWSVMATKFVDIRKARAESRRFLGAFRRETHPLNLFLRRHAFPGSPLSKVYESACVALGIELDARVGADGELFLENVGTRTRLSALQLGTVRNAAERQVADQALQLESKMGALSTAVSASPMLGLLGTVWGVMDAFVAMAQQGMANLTAMAPGIAGALLTTVVGLLVAIPSAVGYNYLVTRIRTLSVQMDNFVDEYMALLQRTFGNE